MRLLLIDIETAPHVVYCWGLFDQNIATNQIISPGYTLCYAAKWLGSDEVLFDSVHKSGAKKMLEGVHALLCEAHAVVSYNGRSFDVPTLNKEFLVHDMAPPSPYKQIDLYQVVKSEFRFPSKKLDYLCKQLGMEGKEEHKGMDTWTGCMRGDAASWADMEKYNRKDVTELEGVYLRLRPWIRNHPNHGLYDEPGVPACTNCGGTQLQRRGFTRTTVGKYARYQCQGCGTWLREAANELPKEDRAVIMRRDLG